MDKRDRKLACEIIRAQFQKTGKYQNWRSVTHDISSDKSNSFSFDFDFLDFSFHQKISETRKKVNPILYSYCHYLSGCISCTSVHFTMRF